MRQPLPHTAPDSRSPNGALWGLAYRDTVMMPERTQGAASYPQLTWRAMQVLELGGKGSGA